MTELELKFQLEPAAAAHWRRTLAAQGASREHLRAIYFDTEDARLAQARVALRLRREGPRWVQTLKAEGESAVHRLEHELVLPHRGSAAPALDIRRHHGNAVGARLQQVLAGTPADALGVRFETDVWRLKRRVLTAGGSEIEIALDLGSVRAGARSEPIAELELEHKGGPIDGLFEVARDIVQHGALWLSTVSKAERGERLRRTEPAAIPDGDPLRCPRHADGAAWLRAVLHHLLAQVLPLASEVAGGSRDVEHIHRLRVGLRRLRTAIRELAPLGTAIDPAWEAPLREAFGTLGQQRDSDAVAAAVRPVLAAAGAVRTKWADDRVVDTAAALHAPALQRVLVQVLALAHAGDDAFAPVSHEALKTLLAKRLQRLHRQVLRDGRRFDELAAEDAHRVRKRLKRLRYLAEFAQPLWPAKAVQRFVERLKPAQEALGAHNDTAVAAEMFSRDAATDPAARFAAQCLQAHLRHTRREARAVLRQLPRDKVFWSES